VATRATRADLLQGVSGDGACRTRADFSGEDRVLCCWLGLNLLLDVFVHSFVTMYSLSMYGTSFIGIFCKESLNVILVRFVSLPSQLFLNQILLGLKCGVCLHFLNCMPSGCSSINDSICFRSKK
jgi:hypothetical protein